MSTTACNTRSAITGIPSGRCLPPAFGMNTRRTGIAVQDERRCCTQWASSAFSCGHKAVAPSTPAVLRPVFCSATRRTATRALLRQRSINRCRLWTRLRSPSRDAVKIRCRSRRTSFSARSQSTWSQSSGLSSGPFTATVVPASNMSVGSSATVIVTFTGSPDPRQRPFRPGQQSLSGRLSDDQQESGQGVVVSRCLSAAGVRFSGHPFPAGDVGLPHGQPTDHDHYRVGPHRDCHVPHMQDATGLGALSTPGRRCPPGKISLSLPAPAASQRPALPGPLPHPICGPRR